MESDGVASLHSALQGEIGGVFPPEYAALMGATPCYLCQWESSRFQNLVSAQLIWIG